MRVLWAIIALVIGIGTNGVADQPSDTGSIPPLAVVAPFSVTPIDDATAEAMQGVSYHHGAPVSLEELRQVHVRYWDLADQEQAGVLVVHEDVAEEIAGIFEELYQAAYPIALIQPIEAYGGNDDASMAANNTSAFNHRVVQGTNKLSQHAYGLAVDINPVQNPYVTQNGVFPEAGDEYLDRGDVRPGMITKGDPCYMAFTQRGWQWGGDYKTVKDYQHFQKKLD